MIKTLIAVLIIVLFLSTAHASLFFTDWELRRAMETERGTYLLLYRNNADDMAPIQWVIAEAVPYEGKAVIVAYAYALRGTLYQYRWCPAEEDYVRYG